jgi:hypothetical protein
VAKNKIGVRRPKMLAKVHRIHEVLRESEKSRSVLIVAESLVVDDNHYQ